MTTCDWAGCSGHLGKFDDCLAEALYDCAFEGLHDWVGSSDFGISAAFLTFDDAATLPIGDGGVIVVPPGFYAVAVDDRGFVYRCFYGSESEQMVERDRLATAYAEWEESE